MTPTVSAPTALQNTILTAAQSGACERLLTLARVRSSTSLAILPYGLLPRWSAPLLVGPAGSGKEYVCQEVARRLGGRPCGRWEIGSWVTVSNRSSGTTLEQIEKFLDDHPHGSVIYLAGIDTLGAAASDRNHSYRQSCLSEIERLLDWTASRSAPFVRRDGTTFWPRVLVVVGGRFAALWGDHDLAGPGGADAWQNADHEPLADVHAVSAWLMEHSNLPASIQRRLAPEPLVLGCVQDEEASRLSVQIHRSLPPLLDGISVDELTTALQGPRGWQAVASVIEQALVSGHENIAPADDPTATTPTAPTSSAAQPVQSASPGKPKKKNQTKPLRLADRLSLGSYRSRLLAQARRLGLTSGKHLEALAVARGYTLPDDGDAEQVIFSAEAWRKEMGDVDLAVALLSPGLEYNERAICRGALMLLRAMKITEPFLIARAAGKERSYAVIRHVAMLGQRCTSQTDHWRKLLAVLPRESTYSPALHEGVMPDNAILDVLALPGI